MYCAVFVAILPKKPICTGVVQRDTFGNVFNKVLVQRKALRIYWVSPGREPRPSNVGILVRTENRQC